MKAEIEAIAHIETDYMEKFGIPRQSGLVPSHGKIIFEPKYRIREAVRGLEGYSHIWLIWQFSQNLRGGWSPTVRPPRLGGNKRVGVFATRSPYRPNEIGLSSVKLEKIEYTREMGTVLHVSGADLLDGTPIFDIKPYIAYTDSHSDAVCGFADEKFAYSAEVSISKELSEKIPSEHREAVYAILKNDPRPSYKADGDRVYAVCYACMEIKFIVVDGVVKVCDIVCMDN